MPRRGVFRGSGSVMRLSVRSFESSLTHGPALRGPRHKRDGRPKARNRLWHTRATVQPSRGPSMQLRTFIAASVIGLSLACASGFAGAQQIYKWKDANGVIHFSQTPPASGMHYTKVHLAGEPEVLSTPPPASSPQDNTGQNARVAARPAVSGGSQPDTPANRNWRPRAHSRCNTARRRGVDSRCGCGVSMSGRLVLSAAKPNVNTLRFFAMRESDARNQDPEVGAFRAERNPFSPLQFGVLTRD